MSEITRFHEFFISARQTNRYVYIRAQVPVLHVAITGSQIPHDLTQFRDIGGGLFWATDVRAADDLHQADARTVQINKGHVWVHVVNGFACILFHVDAFNTHTARHTWAHVHDDFAFAHNRVIKLRDLIALWQVRIEIVFPIKGRP